MTTGKGSQPFKLPPPRFSPSEIQPNTMVGRYRIGAKLGTGRAAVVYRADDTALSRPVAIKFLKADDMQTRIRFQREAKLASSLNHKSIVSIYDFGDFEGVPYIVMELVNGGSLEDVVKRKRPLSADEAGRAGVQAAKALQHLHERGFVHRDITPANLFLSSDGSIKLGDLGLARGTDTGSSSSNPNVTTAGSIIGDPRYIAPELCTGGQAGPLSDIYSLALTIYFLIAGEAPFDGRNLPEILYKQCNLPMPDLRAKVPSAPSAIVGVLNKAASKRPEDRPQTAAQFASELRAALNAPGTAPLPAMPGSPAGSASVALAGGVNTPGVSPSASAVHPVPSPAGGAPSGGASEPLNPESGYRLNAAALLPDVLRNRIITTPGVGAGGSRSTDRDKDRLRDRNERAQRPVTPVPMVPTWMAGVILAMVTMMVALLGLWLTGMLSRSNSTADGDIAVRDADTKLKIKPSPDGKSPDSDSKPAPEPTLLEQVGGPEKVRRMADDFVTRLMANNDVGLSTRAPRPDLAPLSAALAARLIAAWGGPADPNAPGKPGSLEAALAELRLREQQFESMLGILETALARSGVPNLASREFKKRVQTLRNQVVYTVQDTVTNSIGMKFRLIPAGQFLQGSPESEENHRSDELLHPVRITRDFYMGVYEVTQKQFLEIMGENPSSFPGNNNPVETIYWRQAVDFCRRLSEREQEKAAGRRYRLPTEAEWEYACRAGTTTPWNTGAELKPSDANFNNGDGPKPVGLYRPNKWGLYDMHGNVAEWCADYYSDTYYRSLPTDKPTPDPSGPETSNDGYRVIRGGFYKLDPSRCRSAFRFANLEDTLPVNGTCGFRVVLEIPP